jgi:hypothetical protein
VRNPRWNAKRKVLLASVEPTWQNEADVEQTTDLFGELETIVDRYLGELNPSNRKLATGRGWR